MAIVYAEPTSATLAGARDLNRVHRAAGQEDIGFKLEKIISSINALFSSVSALNTAVSALNAGAVSAAGSGVTWSAFSTAPTSSIVLSITAMSNFRA